MKAVCSSSAGEITGTSAPRNGGERLHLAWRQRAAPVTTGRDPAQHVEHLALHVHAVADQAVLARRQPGGDRAQRGRRGRGRDRGERDAANDDSAGSWLRWACSCSQPRPSSTSSTTWRASARRFREPGRQRRPLSGPEQRRHDAAHVGSGVVRQDRRVVGLGRDELARTHGRNASEPASLLRPRPSRRCRRAPVGRHVAWTRAGVDQR